MTSNRIDLAVVGAASLAGEAVLALLAERDFPLGRLFAVDQVELAGSHVEYKDEPVVIHELAEFDFGQVQLAIFLIGAPLAAEYVPKAIASGCIVIDTSVCFRYEDDVPLVIASVNDEVLANYRERMIVAVPSSAASQLIKCIKPIDDAAGIESIHLTVLMSVSEMGKAGQEELGRQTAQLLNFQDMERQIFPAQIAFNLIPESGLRVEGGYTTDELDIIKATHKILNNDKISFQVTVVTVPVFFGHSEVITVKTREALGADKAAELLDNTTGLLVIKTAQKGRPTPVTDASGKDEIVIGRIRGSFSDNGHELSLWSVADNIRSGMALYSVQTAEILVKDYL